MRIRKLESTNGFVAIDVDDVPGQGVGRLAPKILQTGAKDLARSMTYTLASLERRVTGISAGLNATRETAAEAINAFTEEVLSWTDDFRFEAGKGVDSMALGKLAIEASDQFPNLITAAVTAYPNASTALTDIRDPIGLSPLLADRGIQLLTEVDPFQTEADLLFVSGENGSVDHNVANSFRVKTVIPTARLIITTRALATCKRRGITVLPDFLILSAPFIEPSQVADQVAKILNHPDGPVLSACEQAETFIQTWIGQTLYGRPI